MSGEISYREGVGGRNHEWRHGDGGGQSAMNDGRTGGIERGLHAFGASLAILPREDKSMTYWNDMRKRRDVSRYRER